MKKIVLIGIGAIALVVSSCGGAATEGEEITVDSATVENEVVEPVVTDMTIDTAKTVINWNNLEDGELDHIGTISALNGSVQITTTGDQHEITNASLVIDMNSISEESEKFVGHLKADDFFDVNNFATTTFEFDRHENGMVYGKAIIIGKELPVEAPVEVNVEGDNATINVGQFELDFTALEMPFFVEEAKEAKEEERHSPIIQFSATIAAVK